MEGVWLESPDFQKISKASHEIPLQAHVIEKSFRTLGNSPDVIRPV